MDRLVMDIITGHGTFVADLSTARTLSDSIATLSTSVSVPVRCLITDMNHVLGHSVCNAV